MVLTPFATIAHSKDTEHKTSKYCEQLQKQQADMTHTYNHSVALAVRYDGFLSWGYSKTGRDNIQEGTKKQVSALYHKYSVRLFCPMLLPYCPW